MLIEANNKKFENPESGAFGAVLADVVDLGLLDTKWGKKAKIRLVWLLDKNDSENKPYRVMAQLSASMHEKSALCKIVKQILQAQPPVPFESETLIGRCNQLFIVREKSEDGQKEYANVKGILPLPPGVVPMTVPADFIRHKDKKDNQGSAATQPVQAAPQAAAVSLAAPTAADATRF